MYFSEIYLHLIKRDKIHQKFTGNLQYTIGGQPLSQNPEEDFGMSQNEIDEFYSMEYFLLNEKYLEKSPSDEFKKNNANIIQREIITTKGKNFVKKYEEKWLFIPYGKIEYLARDFPFAWAFIGGAFIIVLGNFLTEMVSYFLNS